MKLYRFRGTDYLRLLLLIIICYAYVFIDQIFIPAPLRPFALLVTVLAALTLFFFSIKPENSLLLARTLSLVLGGLVTLIILIQHVIITLDISYKAAIILAITLISPFIGGILYEKMKHRKQNMG